MRRAAAALLLVACLAGPVAAQDFRGLDIGDGIAALEALRPDARETAWLAPGVISTLYARPDGSRLSVTSTEEVPGGRILYMETWHADGTPPARGEGLRIGATTLAEFTAAAGSEGVYFAARGQSLPTPRGEVFFLSYPLAGRPEVYATFAFVAARPAPPQVTPQGVRVLPPDAILDSVILAHVDYLARYPRDWGLAVVERPGAAPIDLGF
ncbi:hypothetical protein [Roseicyclus sp.]|uniref:hypothetical protein n=1 Tax=Roseicyclus sp. TaxID=1914329 RepID=UPI003FA14546